MNPINTNYLSPNKFKIVMERFPNIEFFAQTVRMPSSVGQTIKMNTNVPYVYHETSDKVIFSDLVVEFILEEDLRTYEELLTWQINAASKTREDFNPFSDMTVMFLTNNSNTNANIKFHNVIPEQLSEFTLTPKMSENAPIVLSVNFKFSHITFERAP